MWSGLICSTRRVFLPWSSRVSTEMSGWPGTILSGSGRMLETATMTIAEPSLSLKSFGMDVAMERPCVAGVHFLGLADVIASLRALRASAPKSRSGLALELGLEEARSEALGAEALTV